MGFNNRTFSECTIVQVNTLPLFHAELRKIPKSSFCPNDSHIIDPATALLFPKIGPDVFSGPAPFHFFGPYPDAILSNRSVVKPAEFLMENPFCISMFKISKPIGLVPIVG